MIVVRMRDGLGNQMFQYAIGRKLAESYDTTLKLDARWYVDQENKSVASRSYNLPKFDIRAQSATDEDLRDFFSIGPVPVPEDTVHLSSRVSEVIGVVPTELITRMNSWLFDYYWEIRDSPPSETPSWPYVNKFWPSIFSLSGNLYLAGFWQDPQYFADMRETLQEELTVTRPPSGKNKSLLEEIESTTSIGIHIRRGDYVDMGSELPTAYYRHAVRRIEQSVSEPTYYVFSNDPEWVSKEFDIGRDIVNVRHNDGSTDYEDFRLLRRCDHQIIANSTFSWWAAWLNKAPNKIVCVPDSALDRNPYGFCDDWVPIESTTSN